MKTVANSRALAPGTPMKQRHANGLVWLSLSFIFIFTLASAVCGIDAQDPEDATADPGAAPALPPSPPSIAPPQPGRAESGSTRAGAFPIRKPASSETNALPAPKNLVVSQGGEKKSRVNGLILTERRIPSPETQYPYAIQIIFQAQTNISPFIVHLSTDKPTKMTDGFGIGVIGVISQERSEPPFVISSNHWFKMISPSVTPAHPFVVTLLCSTEFHIISKGWGSQPPYGEKSVVLSR